MRKIIKTVTFDWDSALGDTIKEKYEALYVFLAEQTKLLPADKGQLTIQAAETICSIFESTGAWGYWNKDVVPFFVNGILRYVGEVNNKWALWLDPFMSFEELWLYNDEGMVKVLISNFIILLRVGMSTLSDFLKSNGEKKVRIAVVGDAMVDEYHYVTVKRISPEFPIPVMLSSSHQPDYALPGGAANVAYQLRHFNTSAHLVSLIDSYSLSVFEKAGLSVHGCVEMVYTYGHIPRKKRFYNKDFAMYRWDIEQPRYGIDDDHLHTYLAQLFAQPITAHADIIILSDYDKGVFSGKNQREFLNCGLPTIVDPKTKDIEKWRGCTVFKPNSVEAEALSGQKNWEHQCNYFRERLGCQAVVITQEGDGVVGLCADSAEYFEYRPKNKGVRAESVIGAGDCFIAFLAMAMGHGFKVPQAAEIAFEAGALYVRRKHNEPITPRQLRLRDDPIQAKIAPLAEIKGCPGRLVFTNGCFDLLHAGHVETLKFAKSKGDRLVVAVNTDESVAKLKPGRPYIKLADRMKMLANLTMVDYVVSFAEDTPLKLIEELDPDVLVKGSEYRIQDIVGSEIVKEVYVAPMVAGISTSSLVEKIKNASNS